MKMKITQELNLDLLKTKYAIDQNGLCLGRSILYQNILGLFKQMKLSMAGAKFFSPFGNKTIYGRFMDGHASELLNIRFLLELVEAFDFSKEELEAMLCTEVTFSGVPKMLPFDKSQLPTKAMLGKQLNKLMSGRKTDLMSLPEKIKAQIRAAETGKSYLDAPILISILLLYGLDPAEEILKLKNLTQYLGVDPEYQALIAKNEPEITVSEVMEYIEYLVQKNFQENNEICLIHNAQWIFDNFSSMSPKLVEQLLDSSDTDKKMENLLSFFATFLKISTEDVLYKKLDEINQSEEETLTESVEEETITEGEYQMPNEIVINISGKYFVPCDKNSWKNENPNSDGEGFYWEIMPQEMIENIKMTLMRFDLMEASMNSVRQAILKFCGDTQVKARIQVIGNGFELLFCCAS